MHENDTGRRPVIDQSLRSASRIVERNLVVYRRSWIYLVSGFCEPFFYLVGIGLGLSRLVGDVSVGGRPVSYPLFVAPGLLASAAMNGAIFDTTYNFFFKLKVAKTYEAVLATPIGVREIALGELGWALLRGTIYSAAFLAVMAGFGLCGSPWSLLCLPAAALVSLAFGAVGLAASSFMSAWHHLGSVSLAMLPMFLFSGTFYAVSIYPGWLEVVVGWSPLYQGVALLRALDVGAVTPNLWWHVAYLAGAAVAGFLTVSRRLAHVLTP